ncbi:MAG: NHL repeat-containing protein [Candidatus Eremiobacterota bacterium]
MREISLLLILICLLSGCTVEKIKEVKPLLVFGERGKKDGQFMNFDGIAVDSKGNIYVADIKKVQVFDEKGKFIRSIGLKEGYFKNEVVGVAINSKDFLICADQNNYRYNIFDSQGQFISSFGSRGTEEGKFLKPQGVCVDDKDNIYTADNEADRVQVFSPEGKFLFKFGKTGSGKGEFDEPESITIYKNRIYVADEGNGRIEYFDMTGTYLGETGRTSVKAISLPDGYGKEYEKDYKSYFARDVEGIVFDKEGFLYGANEDEGVIDLFTEKGDLAGIFTSNEQGGLKKIQGLAVNKEGTKLYVCDLGNVRIQIFDIKTIKEMIKSN